MSGIKKQILKLGRSATILINMINRRLIAGVMLFLSIVSGYAGERVPANGFGIVPMPYEAKARAAPHSVSASSVKAAS